MPQRPLVLVAQQYLADPERSSGDVHPIWAYAHAPNGHGGDAERTLTDQIERFAPGFRDSDRRSAVTPPGAGVHGMNGHKRGAVRALTPAPRLAVTLDVIGRAGVGRARYTALLGRPRPGRSVAPA
jgi:hypothetical protein